MKRLSLLAFASVLATLLGGCPIYNENDEHSWCEGDICTDLGPPPTSSGCKTPEGCGINETCGQDNQCHTGDCALWGCADGFECATADDLTVSCVPSTSSGPGGGPNGVVYCGNPADCGAGETCAPDGTCHAGSCDQVLTSNETLGCIYGYTCVNDGTTAVCKPMNPAACGADADCTTLGADYLCVSGLCTAPADQCFDQTQCAGNDKCVEGKCTPACSVNVDCPESYLCETTLGICSKPAQSCAITQECGGPNVVCVDGACVPRSNGASCPEGSVWVENGCIPNQSSNFVCTADGVQDVCAAGSICLHHSCYISCEQPSSSACENQAPSLNECRTVTTASGVHQVCGSSENLGSDCNPQLSCSQAKICVDGFCR